MRLVFLAVLLVWPLVSGAEGLYNRPVLRIDPGQHTATLGRMDVDRDGRFAVTGAHDKTVRVWSVEDGRLLHTIHVPAGSGNVGRIDAVAMSPDGALVAAGGWTRWTENDRQQQIYLFDRESGALRQRISGLPNVVNYLAFLPDGMHLVATLAGANGMRLYRRGAEAWEEVARDSDYGDRSSGASFATDGRFATTSWDGTLRLYDAKGQKIAEAESGGARPFGIAFHPEGDRIAVGFVDSTAVRVFRAADLSPAFDVDTEGIENGNLTTIAWSQDGRTLYAGGQYGERGEIPILSWTDAGRGARGRLPGGQNTLMSLRPLAAGGLMAAGADPWLARIDPAGEAVWEQGSPKADFRAQHSTLSLSADGMRVGFGLKPRGEEPQIFDAASLTLEAGTDPTLAPPEQEALAINDWVNRFDPTLDDTPLPLNRYEMSRSLAIHPDGARFVLGADWTLRAFDGAGTVLWQRAVPGTVWAVNISSDGRYVVAAYGDGTLRWHAMADGGEVLALFPFPDGRNWVAWEPDGRFVATPGAMRTLRWLVNKGWDEAPVTLAANRVPNSFRPEVIRRVLEEGDTMRAVYAAEESERRRAIIRMTGSEFAPGAQLHVLTVGVSEYDTAALRLEFADDDARDLNAALATQSYDLWPYQQGFEMVLTDGLARKQPILNQLFRIRDRMAAAPVGEDLAVIHFSGHGMVVGEEFFLLPHDADLRSEAAVWNSAISGTELRRAIAGIAAHGRVLLLLDACRSGAVGVGGQSAVLDADMLRQGLAMQNVTVLTSSQGGQSSWENPDWNNGAFTEVLLEGLGDAGDANGNGMLSVGELVGYVVSQVNVLTGGAQHPGVEMRYDGAVFASKF